MPASAASHGDGDLIEICSEYGVSVVRIDDTGNVTDPEDAPCPKCSDCPVCAIIAVGDMPTNTTAVTATTLGQRLLLRGAQPYKENPAQFWANNRGPPLRTEKAIDLAKTQFMGLPCIDGRAPWI